jgi:hypothetical protein
LRSSSDFGTEGVESCSLFLLILSDLPRYQLRLCGRFRGVGGAPFFGGRAYRYYPEQERDRFGLVEVLKAVFREDHFTAVRIERQANFTRA